MNPITALLFVAAWLWTTTMVLADETNRLKFGFGTGQPAPGFTAVTATSLYNPGAGFGFEPGASVIAQGHCVTSDKPFLFSVKLPEGNYTVTLMLGDEVGEFSTTVKAEARRLMLESVRTDKG